MLRAVLALALVSTFGCGEDAPSGVRDQPPGHGPSDQRDIDAPSPWATPDPEPLTTQDPTGDPAPERGADGDEPEAPAPIDPPPEERPAGDPAVEPTPDPVHEAADCPPALGDDTRLSVHVRYTGGDALEPGDSVTVAVDLASPRADQPAWVRIAHANVRADEPSVRLDGAPVADLIGGGDVIRIPLAGLAPARITYTARLVGDPGPVSILAALERIQGACPEPGAGSGAILQPSAASGRTKGEACVDVRGLANLQLSTVLNRRGTAAYRDANGVRDDLWADDFIYCPGPPTVAYSTEVCLIADPAAATLLAGAPALDAGGAWSVDDFALFELLDPATGGVLADTVTAQSHPGADTFWCPSAEVLMCRGGCTASLRRTSNDREVPPLAVVESTGAAARTLPDGEIALTGLFAGAPADTPATLRMSVLDVGEVGAVTPDLYLIFTR